MRRVKAGVKNDGLLAFLMLVPFLGLLLIFYVYPVFHNIWLSLTNYSGLKLKGYSFVGLENYKEIFTEGVSGFLGMLVWTITFAVFVVCISFLLGTVLAVVLDKTNIVVSKIYRGIFILPWVIPAVITLLMWRGLLNTNDGLVNQILTLIGIPKVPWLTDPLMAKVSSIVVMVWFSFPYFMIVAQGILKSIPKQYYEAAGIDGASDFQSFFRITVPLTIKAILPTLVMAFIMQFNQFGIYMLTAGEPAAQKLGDPGATDLLITYVFNTAFNTYRYNLAAAYSVIIFIFIATFTFLSMKAGKKIGRDS